MEWLLVALTKVLLTLFGLVMSEKLGPLVRLT